MATIIVNSCTLHYQEMGSGLPIVFTPGGRASKHIMRPVAEAMSPQYRTVIYDRRNCGASDVTISGDESEQEIWAEDLAQLIQQLDIGPAYLGGWSAGCRVSLLTAIRHPELVRGLLLGWVTGGAVGSRAFGVSVLWPIHRGGPDGRHGCSSYYPALRRAGRREPGQP